jgi:hypothetical protein
MRTAFSAFATATAIAEPLFFLLTTVLLFGMSLIQCRFPHRAQLQYRLPDRCTLT